MRKAIVLLFLTIGITALAAQEYGPGSDQVNRLRLDYIKAGKLFPQTSFPVTRNRLEALAAAIGVSIIGLEPRTSSGIDGYGFLELALDGRLTTATNIIQPDAPRDGLDLYRAWLSRPAFARFGGVLASSSGLSIEIEGELKKPWAEQWFSFHNVPLSDTGGIALDNHALNRGILSYENDAFRLWLGRDAVHFGPAGISTLYPSSRLPYLDAGRLQSFLGDFHFDWVLGTFHGIQSWEGTDVDPAPGGFYNDSVQTPTTIYFGVHRFGYSGEKFRFAIGEEIFYARPSNSLEFNDILPIATWHGLDLIPDNMSLILELGYSIMPGLSVHGFAGFDDINGNIFGVADGEVPTIDAYIIGAEYCLGDEVMFWDGIAEAGYTHYLWGNFDAVKTAGGSAPMYLAKHVARYAYNGGGMLVPFSSPYGPGAMWIRSSNDVRFGDSDFKLGLDILVLSKNDRANLISTDYASSDTVANASRTLFLDIGIPVSHTFNLGLVTLTACLEPSVQFLRGNFSASLDLSGKMSIGRGVSDMKQ